MRVKIHRLLDQKDVVMGELQQGGSDARVRGMACAGGD